MRNPAARGWPDAGERTPDREIAERWKWAYLSLMRGEHRARVLGQPKRDRTLGAAMTEYMEHRQRTVLEGTWQNDRSALLHLIDQLGSGRRVQTIAAKDFQATADRMLDAGYAVGTIRNYMGQLGGFADWAGCERPDVDLPRPAEPDVRAFDATERARLREAADKVDRLKVGKFPNARLAVEIGLCMGLRQGEIFALRWEDIDADRQEARVQLQIPKNGGAPRGLKGKRARSVLILPDWWAWHREDATGWICHHEGRTVNYRSQRNLIERVLDTSGLNDIGLGWHALRHSYGREFVERDGLIQELAVSMGHSSVTITWRVYGHFMQHVALGLARSRIYPQN
jgi:integrase